MPNHKSCKKRMVTSAKANEKNRAAKSRMRTAVKRVLSATKKDEAQAELAKAYSVIDKTAKIGVIHPKNASNKKARLARAVAKVEA